MRGPSKVMLMLLVVALIAVPGALRAQQGAGSAGSTGGTATRPGAVSRAGVVSGTVYDSVTGAPLARAVVQMSSEAGADLYTATTDASGHYELPDVAAGSYLATFFHPALDALGLEPVLRRVEVGDVPATRLDFAVPSASTIWALTCQPANSSDSTGLLLGHVRNAESGAPVIGAKVMVHWSELLFDSASGLRAVPRHVTAETNDVGMYAMCGLPSDGSIGVLAVRGTAESGAIAIQVPARGVLQTELAISAANTRVVLATDSAGLDSGTVLVRGTARLAGSVRSQAAQPMGDVELRVLGTGARGRTAKDGSFLLTDLPAGSYMLETRRLGLAPARAVVELASGRTAQVEVRVHEAVVLSAMTIYGKPHANRAMERLSGFLKRKRTGWGHYLTREDVQRRQPFNTTDLFRGMLGVRVSQAGVFDNVVRMRGGVTTAWCRANVFLDGAMIIRNRNIASGPLGSSGDSAFGAGTLDEWVNPDDIAAVEVYPELMQAPAQFRGNNCGSIVIWTRYAFPYAHTEQ